MIDVDLEGTPDLDDDEQRQAWRIHSDREASWAMRKLAAAVAEIARLERDAADEIDALNVWLEAAVAGPTRDAVFFEQALIAYRHQLEEANPELPKTYKIPGGVITRRKQTDLYVVTDPSAFVAWALREGHAELVKIEPRTSGLKDYGIPGRPETGALVDHNGEVVPGAEQVVRGDTYSAKPG